MDSEGSLTRTASMSVRLSYLLFTAERLALFSKDPSTKIGSVIFKWDNRSFIPYRKLGSGYNRYPLRYPKGSDYNNREYKYANIVHAEMAAIFDAVRKGLGAELPGASLISTFPICDKCAPLIVEAGIANVIWKESKNKNWTNRDNWDERAERAIKIFTDGGVSITCLP